MKICIVNPGRCGSTVVLASLANKLDNFSMIYEVINYENGLYVLQANQNIIFKYQFLYALTPLKGADKYIIVDRKDKDAWIYSTYMSAVNYHWHGSLKNTENKFFDQNNFDVAKDNLLSLYKNYWIPERERLLTEEKADIIWQEDINITEDVYIDLPPRKNIKLTPVWSPTYKGTYYGLS